jgi:hypothetical protein
MYILLGIASTPTLHLRLLWVSLLWPIDWFVWPMGGLVGIGGLIWLILTIDVVKAEGNNTLTGLLPPQIQRGANG